MKNGRQEDVWCMCVCVCARRIYYRILSAKEYKWNRCEWQWRCIRKFPFEQYVNDTFLCSGSSVGGSSGDGIYACVHRVSRDTFKNHGETVKSAACAYIFSRQLYEKVFRLRWMLVPLQLLLPPSSSSSSFPTPAPHSNSSIWHFFIGRFCENICSNVYLHFIAHITPPFWLHYLKIYVDDTTVDACLCNLAVSVA